MEVQQSRTLTGKILRMWPVLVGALGGYVYYAAIGCVSGTCPMTSNPWISTAYGAAIGALLLPRGSKKLPGPPRSDDAAREQGSSRGEA